MKRSSYKISLPLISLLAGAMGYLLSSLLFRFGTDEKGLLLLHHPLKYALLALAFAVLLWAFWACRRAPVPLGIPVPVPVLLLATLSTVAGILLFGRSAWQAAPSIGILIVIILGAGAGVCLLLSLFVPKLRVAGPTLCSMFFAVHSLLRYRMSRSDPLLQDYIFSVLAELCLTLMFYHIAAYRSACDKSRRQTFFQCCAIFLCCTAAYRGGIGFLLLLPGLIFTAQEE